MVTDEEMEVAYEELMYKLDAVFYAYRKRTGVMVTALSAVTYPFLQNGKKKAYVRDITIVRCEEYEFDQLDPAEPVCWPVQHEATFKAEKLEWVTMEVSNDQK